MLFATALTTAALLFSPANALWPVPKKLTTGKDVLYIDQTVKVTYNGEPIPFAQGYSPRPGAKFNSKDIIQGGVSRLFESIFNDNFVPWRLHERHSNFEPNAYGGKKLVKSIRIEQSQKDSPKNFKPLAGDVDESYTLPIEKKGVII